MFHHCSIISATCEDLHNTVECQGWANSGECRINPDWMIPNCRKSCKKCRGGDTDTEKRKYFRSPEPKASGELIGWEGSVVRRRLSTL